jgi:hypothetical protein
MVFIFQFVCQGAFLYPHGFKQRPCRAWLTSVNASKRAACGFAQDAGEIQGHPRMSNLFNNSHQRCNLRQKPGTAR